MGKSLPSRGGRSAELAAGRAAMERLLKQVLGPLEKKGERELQRFSRRLEKCLLREGEKLLAEDTPEGGAEPAADINGRGDSAEHYGLTHPDRIRDLAGAHGTDVPPESAATAVQSEPLPAGATSGAAVVLRSPEVSEIFQSQPLAEGSHVAFSCFVAGYFPQELTVTWLRRESGASVATPIEDSADYAISQKETRTKDKETYQQMVTLSFAPSAQRDRGAEFICQVGHVALRTPIERSTGTLEVKGVATPDTKEVAPDDREVTSVSKEVAPETREVTPVFKEVSRDSREFKPISREDRGSTAGRKETHFVDRHREKLIQRVTLVEGVLDKLLGDNVLDNEQYLTITAEKTNPMKMRKLYEFMVSWNKYCKDQLYEALKDKCKFLVADLEGE
ncbi:uncharacterized protein ACDP82_004834 [Pangshura tecta]